MASSPPSTASESRATPPLESFPDDHRGSPVPTWGMISTRIMELRKRRGLMIALAVVNIGIPSLFLIIRLIMHAAAPKSYGPAGGSDVFGQLIAGVMFIFGFIVAATLGCTAGSVDLSEGVFRHLVVTGRSRVALYFARIPAGLAILVPMVASGFVIVCAVCVFAAPTQFKYDGISVPSGLSQSGFVNWSESHYTDVICAFNYQGPINIPVPCGGPGGGQIVQVNPKTGQPVSVKATKAQLETLATKIANQNYVAYHDTFLKPPASLMVQSFLWLELETIIGFCVGLGLASLMGQRTVPVVLMIILEIVLTPLLAVSRIPYMLNVQRAVVGIATAHVEPSGLPQVFSGGNNGVSRLVPETTAVAIIVIVAWLAVWTTLGAWRMARRDV